MKDNKISGKLIKFIQGIKIYKFTLEKDAA